VSERPSLAAFVRSQVDAIRAEPRPAPTSLWFSSAGRSCPRELYYQATQAPREEAAPDARIKMALGSAFDAYALRGVGNVVAQMPVRLEVGGVVLTGRADVVFVEAARARLVSDLKVVGDRTWADTEEAPKDEHRAQVNLYAYALGAPEWSVCYVCAATGEIREHFGALDVYQARRDLGLFEDAAYWLKRGEPPPRPFEDYEDDETGKVNLACNRVPCRRCSYRPTCWATSEGETT
jgi:hypothetical protein